MGKMYPKKMHPKKKHPKKMHPKKKHPKKRHPKKKRPKKKRPKKRHPEAMTKVSQMEDQPQISPIFLILDCHCCHRTIGDPKHVAFVPVKMKVFDLKILMLW